MLWLFGAPKTGKSYLALQFAKAEFEGYIYLNLADDAALREDLKLALGSKETDLFAWIGNEYSVPLEYKDRFLYIFDECDALGTGLFAFTERLKSAKGLPVMMITREKPVETDGVNVINLFPMEYDEFLVAMGKDWYVEIIRGHFQNLKKIPSIIHEELLSLFEEYLVTGGMPDVVKEHAVEKSPDEMISSRQREIAEVFNVSLKGEDNIGYRATQILDVMPQQLLKDNKQFRFSLIRKGATLQDYEVALNKLQDTGIVYRLDRLIQEGKSSTGFILYHADHGILNSMIESTVPTREGFDPVNMESINPNKELLLKNCFMMHAVSSGKTVAYWQSEYEAKVDFVEVDRFNNRYIPYLITSKINKRSKSINAFNDIYHSDEVICLSEGNFMPEKNYINIPYYATFCL